MISVFISIQKNLRNSRRREIIDGNRHDRIVYVLVSILTGVRT